VKSLAGSFRKIQDESGSYEGGGKIKGAGLKAAATNSIRIAAPSTCCQTYSS